MPRNGCDIGRNDVAVLVQIAGQFFQRALILDRQHTSGVGSTGGKGRAIRPSGKLDARSGQGRMQLCRFGPDRLRCPIKPPGNQADMHVF